MSLSALSLLFHPRHGGVSRIHSTPSNVPSLQQVQCLFSEMEESLRNPVLNEIL